METSNIRCNACGANVSAGKFCGECGTALDPLAPPAPVDTPDPEPAPPDTPDANATPAGEPTPVEETPAEESSQRKWWLLGGAVLAVAAVAAFVWFAFVRDDTNSHAIDGTFTLIDADEFLFDDEGDPCSGSGGYSDVRAGAQVRIRDGEGRSLANAHLGSGEIAFAGMCEFAWTAEVAPSDFYRIEMGRRGELEYTYEEMVDNDWQVSLSLGSVDD